MHTHRIRFGYVLEIELCGGKHLWKHSVRFAKPNARVQLENGLVALPQLVCLFGFRPYFQLNPLLAALYSIERQINKSKNGSRLHVGTAREQYFHHRLEIVCLVCLEKRSNTISPSVRLCARARSHRRQHGLLLDFRNWENGIFSPSIVSQFLSWSYQIPNATVP